MNNLASGFHLSAHVSTPVCSTTRLGCTPRESCDNTPFKKGSYPNLPIPASVDFLAYSILRFSLLFGAFLALSVTLFSRILKAQKTHDNQRRDRVLRFFLRLEIGEFSPYLG